jgi:hypothetical protein
VTLHATVTSETDGNANTVNEGMVVFSIYSGSMRIGTSVTSEAVVNGVASAVYTLPGGTAGGNYSIEVSYTGTADYASSDNSADTTFPALTVVQPPSFTSPQSAIFLTGQADSFEFNTNSYPVAALSISGTLPPGVTFVDNGNGTATLGGAPAATTGVYVVNVSANNGSSPVLTQAFTLTVADALAVTSGAGTTFSVGKAGLFTVTTTTGLPTLTTLSESGHLRRGREAVMS